MTSRALLRSHWRGGIEISTAAGRGLGEGSRDVAVDRGESRGSEGGESAVSGPGGGCGKRFRHLVGQFHIQDATVSPDRLCYPDLRHQMIPIGRKFRHLNAANLIKKPRTPLGLINPVLDEACGGNIS